MFKKIMAVLMVFAMLLAVGCGAGDNTSETTAGKAEASSQEVEKVVYEQNPLTGISELTDNKQNDRPVAIMINNLSTAQGVQAGVDEADIVYETEVEGGITRLMAVYQDVSKVEKIGTIRSARYAYVDLAMGHNAIYIHHGQDPIYCKPHLKDTDDINITTSNYGTRIKNGLSTEHTLYTTGSTLWNGLVKDKVKTENSKPAAWQSFAAEDEQLTFENSATKITVPFSSSYKTIFEYNSETGEYTRYFKNVLRKDYFTGETTTVKNVFILKTSIVDYPDGKHRKIALESGTGFYCVNGTYTPIKWSKGAAKNGFKFTNSDGTPLTVNSGSSWVCIAKTASKEVLQ